MDARWSSLHTKATTSCGDIVQVRHLTQSCHDNEAASKNIPVTLSTRVFKDKPFDSKQGNYWRTPTLTEGTQGLGMVGVVASISGRSPSSRSSPAFGKKLIEASLANAALQFPGQSDETSPGLVSTPATLIAEGVALLGD